MVKQPWYVGILAGRQIAKPTKGVSDYDGTAEIYGREPQKRTGPTSEIQYGKGETFILESIHAIRRKFPEDYDRLRMFRELKTIAEGAHLSGRDAEAINDIKSAIDEIEMKLGH